MKKLSPIALILCILTYCQTAFSQNTIPHLIKKGTATQLIVEGKPFIILGGELGNSSATTPQYMQPIWGKLKLMNLNTVLIPVYWELIEAVEGKFDFSLYQNLIVEARKNELKIVFLWFGDASNVLSLISRTPSSMQSRRICAVISGACGCSTSIGLKLVQSSPGRGRFDTVTIAALLTVASLYFSERGKSGRSVSRILPPLVFVGFVMVALFIPNPVLDRFDTDPLSDSRIAFARNTSEAARAYMPFGAGVG